MSYPRPHDTSEDAWNVVRAIHARLGPQGRVEAAFAVSELAREAAWPASGCDIPSGTKRASGARS